MFNLFTNNTAKDIIDSMPAFAWKLGPTFYIDEKEYTIRELIEYVKNLIKENNDLEAQLNSIEKDGTEEHNNAVKLRQEIAELKVEIEKYSKGNKNWMNLYQEVVDKNNELLKEVLGLRHLKQENLNLIDRVNEIDSDVIRDLNDEIFTLKNANAVLKSKVRDWEDKYAKSSDRELEKRLELEKEYEERLKELNNSLVDNTKENKEFCKIIEEQSKKLGQQKDEIEKLKKDIVDYVFEKDNQVNFFEEELKRLKSITKEEYDKIPVVGSADIIGNLLQKAKDLTEGVEVDLDKSLDEQCDKEDEPAFLKCACGDCHEKTKQYNQFHDDMYYQDAYAEKKEKSWEEAASDLALRVAKLEEQLKYTQKIICQK